MPEATDGFRDARGRTGTQGLVRGYSRVLAGKMQTKCQREQGALGAQRAALAPLEEREILDPTERQLVAQVEP